MDETERFCEERAPARRREPGELRDVGGSAELLRRAVDAISAMLAFWDADGRCRFATRAYERWFGVSPEALIGKHISELLGPLYALNLPYIEGALRGERQEFERDIPDPAGGPPRHSLAVYVPDVADGVVRGFFALVTDVSAMKRTERALRESEERFRLAVDEAPIGMAVVAIDGRFMRVNHVLCEIVGYPPDELMNLTFQEITHPDDLDADLALTSKLHRGEIPRFTLEKRYLRKDGTPVDVVLSGSAVRGPDGVPLYYIAQIEDITERKRLENELRFAEARSSGILTSSADAIVSIDEAQRITMFNEGAERIFGWSRAEAIGASLDILIPESLRATHRREVERFAAARPAARRMGEREATITAVRKNGEEFAADAAISKLEIGEKRILTVTLRDVSEEKRIEREQRFLAEVGPVLAASLDYEATMTAIAEVSVREIADLCIVDIVESGEEIRRVRVATRDPSKAWLCAALTRIPPDRPRPSLLDGAMKTGRPFVLQRPSDETLASFAASAEHLRALRAAKIHSIVAVPLVARGEPLGAMAFVSSTPSRTYGPADVRLAEEIARRAALSIEHARMYRAARRATETRDEVLGIVAHDLRNPLNLILMSVALLRPEPNQPERRSRMPTDTIERAARRMNKLIQDLLDVTRMDAGHLALEPTSVRPAQLVSEVRDAERQLAVAASVELELDLAPDLPEVSADRDRLLQVFENLVGNALKFTPAGGRITIGAARRGGDVLFWVQDTGCGIPTADLPHVFDRFWQARRTERRGAGLGLPIVKGLVEAHRGRIWVESAPDAGTRFSFTIPVA